jgi:hypothetical protein
MLQQNSSYIEGAGGTLEIVAARKKLPDFFGEIIITHSSILWIPQNSSLFF